MDSNSLNLVHNVAFYYYIVLILIPAYIQVSRWRLTFGVSDQNLACVVLPIYVRYMTNKSMKQFDLYNNKRCSLSLRKCSVLLMIWIFYVQSILLSLLSNTLSLRICSSLRLRNKASRPHETCKITWLVNVLGTRRQCKWFWAEP